MNDKKNKSCFNKIIIIGLGIISFLWFIIRVIPKPSRAAYPCQQAAFPFASTFVLWLVANVFSIKLVKTAWSRLSRGKITIGVIHACWRYWFIFDDFCLE